MNFYKSTLLIIGFLLCLVALPDLFVKSAHADGAWTTCAVENGVCWVPKGSIVRYGLGNDWFTSGKPVHIGIPCDSGTFGGDPAENRIKICQYKWSSTAIQYQICAVEGSTCRFDGIKTVYYGLGNNYYSKDVNAGPVECSNRVFGDPAPNKLKVCWIESR